MTELFENMLGAWLVRCQDKIVDHYNKNLKNSTIPNLDKKVGKKYVKIVQTFPNQSLTGSAWAFVDIATGDILRAASWNAPAKHARGNIYDVNGGMGSMTVYGPNYIHRNY